MAGASAAAVCADGLGRGDLVLVASKLGNHLEPRAAYRLFAGLTGTLFAGFLFTSFGVDPSGRYFLPLAVPLALIAGERAWSLGREGKVRVGVWGRFAILGLIVVYQVWGNLQVALRYPPGITTQIDQQTIIDHRSMAESDDIPA